MTTRGFFTIAQGEKYQRLAYALALSLKLTQPNHLSKISIGITPGERSKITAQMAQIFDDVIDIPWADHAANSKWKLENEWKCIHMTPYDETIKLDADMLFPQSIESWWDTLQLSEGVFCTSPRTYRGDVIRSDFYRKTFTESALPNIYTAFFYFKKTDINYQLFELAGDIFSNWERFFEEFLKPDSRPKIVSTDVVFAIAAKILDYCSLNKTSFLDVPTFVHLKSRLQDWPDNEFMNEDWTKMISSSFTPSCSLKIGTFRQTLPVHYHVKEFVTDDMIQKMERALGL